MNWTEPTDVLMDEHGEVVGVEDAAADACHKGNGGLQPVSGHNNFNVRALTTMRKRLSRFSIPLRVVGKSKKTKPITTPNTAPSTQCVRYSPLRVTQRFRRAAVQPTRRDFVTVSRISVMRLVKGLDSCDVWCWGMGDDGSLREWRRC